MLHYPETAAPAAPPAAPRPERRYRTIWISDIHLGTKGCQADLLLDFLRHTQSARLYLVGDVVDGWQLKKRWYWPQSHNDVIHAILRKVRAGTEVMYIAGNHDEMVRDFLGLSFGGVRIENEWRHETADGRRLLILHGDQFDAVMGYAKWLAHVGDVAYTLLLGMNTALNTVRRRMGFSYWSLSAYLKAKAKSAVSHISRFEDFIAREAARAKAQGVVCGHIHKAEMRDMNGVLYCNDGDWVESCTALVEHENGRLEILRWAEIMRAEAGVSAPSVAA